jgi:ADP-ribose pyrophosphatase YjhB (NUDIX family)
MRIATVRCIVKSFDKGKVLLCYSKKDKHYFLPGGGIKFQELAEEAIYREFKEEMGLEKDQIKVNKFIGITENMFDDAHGIDVVFDVDIDVENIVSFEPDKIDFFWVDIENLDNIDIRPAPIKEMIKDAKNNHIISITIGRKNLDK